MILLFAVTGTSMIIEFPSMAAQPKSTKSPTVQKSKKAKKAQGNNLQKTLTFNEHLVRGKHQVPGEGLVTVENEKPVFNLLSIRTDFKDRRDKERKRD
jgi:hypothetical protein